MTINFSIVSKFLCFFRSSRSANPIHITGFLPFSLDNFFSFIVKWSLYVIEVDPYIQSSSSSYCCLIISLLINSKESMPMLSEKMWLGVIVFVLTIDIYALFSSGHTGNPSCIIISYFFYYFFYYLYGALYFFSFYFKIFYFLLFLLC